MYIYVIVFFVKKKEKIITLIKIKTSKTTECKLNPAQNIAHLMMMIKLCLI